MKKIAKLPVYVSMAVGLIAVPAVQAGGGGKGADCDYIGSKTRSAASSNPSGVLGTVSSAIYANESCACEIVKGAIVGSKADNKTVGDIVYTAVTAAPSMAATIAECAVAVAPGASAEIKDALSRALDGDGTDFGKLPVDIRGVYLIPPISPSASNIDSAADAAADTSVRNVTVNGVSVRAVVDGDGNVIEVLSVLDGGAGSSGGTTIVVSS